MERLTIDQEYIDQLAQQEYEGGATDTDIDPEHRRDRVALDDHDTPVAADSVLKRDDHVRLWHWVDAVVVGPARHEDFVAYHVPELASMMGPILVNTIDAVTDRAPYHEGEQPMPVTAPPTPTQHKGQP